LLVEPTRRRVYDFVVVQGEIGRDGVSSGVGITRELAAFHLDRLAKAGLLETHYRRVNGRTGPGAGRPAKLYSRSKRDIAVSLPERRYANAAGFFAGGLERLATRYGSDAVEDAVNDTAREEGAAAGAARAGHEQLIEVLAQGGYEPREDAATGRITLANCPFRMLSNEHRDLTCNANLAWAEGLTGAVENAHVKPRLEPAPGRCCVVFDPVD
jgi:predicted ArsR family transcriptional regulator